jgi:hypothetical protein
MNDTIRHLVTPIMIASGLSAFLSAEGARADPQVDVKVYSGFSFRVAVRPIAVWSASSSLLPSILPPSPATIGTRSAYPSSART